VELRHIVYLVYFAEPLPKKIGYLAFITMSGPSFLTPEILLTIATLVAQYETPFFFDKTPSHTSVLTGSRYVQELLSSKKPSTYSRCHFRMPLFWPHFSLFETGVSNTTTSLQTDAVYVCGRAACDISQKKKKIVGENASNRSYGTRTISAKRRLDQPRLQQKFSTRW
jgi:hypothetical protein